MLSVRLALLISLSGFSLFAQEFRATLTGRVTDASGSAVPNVVVTARNIDTNEASTSISSNQGSYTIPFLRPGNYTVAVDNASGFKRFTREGLVLNVSQTVTVNIALEIGQLTEQVTVTAETPLLESAKADRGTVILNKQVNELPLNARNPFMLSALVAGVNYNGNAIYQRPFDNGAIADWSINGSRNRQGEFLLDGAPNNAQAGGNNIAYVPPVDSVQEFKIQTNSYDAQYGKTAGGIVNVTLKSGANDIHGTLYEFMRRRWLDANSFQNNARGVDRTNHYLDQYGGMLSGPVILPKLYNGKNRTFFMTNYEGYREGSPNPINASVPAPEFLNGDFSRLRTPQNALVTIYDPNTGRDVGGNWVRSPFPGNVIPQSRINPIARRILGYYKAPNTTTAGANYAQQNFFISPNVATDDFYNFTVKIDQNLGSNHRFFFRHASNDRTETRSTNGISDGPGQDGQFPLKRVNDAYVIDWVSNLTPTLIFNLRPSFSRYIEGSRGDGNRGFDITSLGFSKALQDQLPVAGFFGRYEFSDYLPLGRYFNFNYTNTVAVHPTFTWIKGAHTFKMGVDYRQIQYNVQNSGNVFQLNFTRDFTQEQFNRGDQLSGNSIASALLGAPNGGQVQANVFPAFRYLYMAPYFQDDWKVTSKLTLNLGLRWDLNTTPLEAYDRMNRGFNPDITNPVDRMIDRTQFTGIPTLKGGLEFAGVNGNPRRATDTDYRTFQPRIGVAYQVARKLVLRGGFGMYVINPNNRLQQTANFSLATPLVRSNDAGRTPVANLLNDPYPVVQTPPGNSTGYLSMLGRGFNYADPGFRLPYTNQFSFGFQYEMPFRSVIDISYVGNRSHRLQNFDDETRRDLNHLSVADRSRCNPLEGGTVAFCDVPLPNPFRNLAPFLGTNAYSATVVNRSGLLTPYPHFGNLWEEGRNDGRLWYNAMQLTYTVRDFKSLNFTVAYTLQKTLEQQVITDVPKNIIPRTLSANDRPHRLVMNGIYDLPFGRGRVFLGTAGGLLNGLVSGWQLTSMVTFQSGTPWDLPTNVRILKDPRVTPNWSDAQVRGVSPCVLRYNDNGTITPQNFSVAAGCGTDPSNYAFLILPRFAPREMPDRDARIRLHTVGQWDASINKTTSFGERWKVQFRAEAFNLTNTYMFYRQQWNNNPENANFGTLFKANVGFGDANFPRQYQLAVKLLF